MCPAGNAEKRLHLIPASFYITILQQLNTLGGHRFIMACVMACIMACIMACCTIHDVVYIFQNDPKISCRRIKVWSTHFCIAWQFLRFMHDFA